MPITLSQRIDRSAEIVETQLDGQVVLLHFESGTFYHIGGTGLRVWELCGDGAKVETVVETLCHEFEVTPDQCLADLTPMLTALKDSSIIELRED